MTDDGNLSFIDRAKFVPVRLTYNERKYLRLVEGATAVSVYSLTAVSVLFWILGESDRSPH